MKWFTYAAWCGAATMFIANMDRVLRMRRDPNVVCLAIMIGCFLAAIIFGAWEI